MSKVKKLNLRAFFSSAFNKRNIRRRLFAVEDLQEALMSLTNYKEETKMLIQQEW